MNPNDPLDDTQGSSVPPFLPEPGSAFARNSLLPAGGSVGGQYHQPQASDRYRSTGSYPAPEYTRPAAQPLPAYDSGYPGAYGGPGRAGEGLGYSVGRLAARGWKEGCSALAHTSRLQQQHRYWTQVFETRVLAN
ncbi:hypothetical protein DIPPA_10083 [Diplonema papillatum]|nr:hypothetical protein DIPPA_10083 [Diplonema papillatum]